MFLPAHYVCDLCQRVLETDEERFVLRMETCGDADGGAGKIDGDRDYLEEIDDLLERGGDLESAVIEDSDSQPLVEYHLCDACHQKFLLDPLGRRKTPQLNFSKN